MDAGKNEKKGIKVRIPVGALVRVLLNYVKSPMFVITVVLLLLSAVGIGAYLYISRKAVEDEDAKIVAEMDAEIASIDSAKNETKVARVGREYLFVSDVKNYAVLRGMSITEIDYEQAIDDLIDQSVLLQAGADEGWIELDSSFFNNPFKDYEERNKQIRTVTERFESEKRGSTVVEAVSVWFWNSYQGKMAKEEGLEAAMEFARQKIQGAYDLVVREGKSMYEASRVLYDDESISQIDPAYKVNVFFTLRFPAVITSVNDVRGGVSYGRDGLYEFLRVSEEGDVSEIQLERDLPDDSEYVVDAYYVFYRLVSRSSGTSDLEGWIADQRSKLTITRY